MTRSTEPPAGRRRRARSSAAERFGDLPTRIQLLIAALGLLIAALGVTFAGMQALKEDPAPTAIVIRPEAFIVEVVTGGGEVTANGSFRNVDLASEVILFVGHPADEPGAAWLPVEAEAAPAPSATGERVSGVWEALRPFDDDGRFGWQVYVVPAGSGATDGYADIRERGPESELVLAASEEFFTGE